jgi:hypothetical protein
MEIFNVPYLKNAGLVTDQFIEEDYFVFVKKDASADSGYRNWLIKATDVINVPTGGNPGDFLQINNLGDKVWLPGPGLGAVMAISNILLLPMVSPNGLNQLEITNTGTKITGPLNLSGLPTSPVGLSAGDVWNNAGIPTII